MKLFRKIFKPLLALLGIAGAMAGVWWFALKPDRRSDG